jgi:predicted nucleotidyltransferase
MLAQAITDIIISRIVATANPISIILFGSHAYGTPDNDSDIDLLVVEDDGPSKRRESVRLWELLADIPIAKDIIVATREEFEFYRGQAGSVYRTAYEKGVVLYAR